MTWHCCYTEKKCERRVSNDLWTMGYMALILTRPVRISHAGKSRIEMRWAYPRYVFAQLPDRDAIADAIYLRGVHHLIGGREGPIRVPQVVIDKLVTETDASGAYPMEEEAYRKRIRAGQAVRIADGPMAGLFALVIQDLGDEIEAWVQAFGRDRVKLRFNANALVLPAA